MGQLLKLRQVHKDDESLMKSLKKKTNFDNKDHGQRSKEKKDHISKAHTKMNDKRRMDDEDAA